MSLFLRDRNPAAAAALVQRSALALALTPLQRHELRKAVRRAVFRTRGTPAQVTELDAAMHCRRSTPTWAKATWLKRLSRGWK